MRKTVLLLVPSLSTGGQEKIAVETAKALESEYNVKLVLFYKSKVEYDTNCEKIYLNVGISKSKIKKIFGQLRRIFKLSRVRRKTKADIVYSFGDSANIANVASGIFSRGKSVISIHSYPLVKKNCVNDFVYKNSDEIILISQEMKTKLKSEYPKIKNYIVVENGYDVDNIKNLKLEKVDFSNGKPSFVAMGRLDTIKRFDFLIKAFSVVKREFANATLTFVGCGDQIDLLENLRNELGLTDSVSFLGYQKNPYPYVSMHDVFVLSSLNEGFPNALVESLACGVACVSVDCKSGPREILSENYSSDAILGVIQEKYGVLVEQSNDEELVVNNLAKAMIDISKDEIKLNYYKLIGQERANAFSTMVCKEKLIKLFERL